MKTALRVVLATSLLAGAMFAQITVDVGDRDDLRAAIRSKQSALVISVNDWGARDDGKTDNTAIFNQGLAAAAASHPGATIFFPCTGSGTYNVAGSVKFVSGLTYRGGGGADHCRISSHASGNYAFSFVGATNTSLYDITLYSANSQNPPKVAVLFGRPPENPTGNAADHYWQRVHVGGYATTAMVYMNAAESQVWIMPVIHQNGGGAQYGLYISDSDDLNVYGGPPNQSDTFLNFYGLAVMNVQPPNSFAADSWEAIHLGGQSTQDVHFTGGGYVAMPGDGGPRPYGTAFGLRPNGRNTMGGPIEIDGFRVEGANYFLQAEANNIRGLRVWGNNMASHGSAAAFVFVAPGVTLTNANIQANSCQNGTVCNGHVIAGTVQDSVILEPDMAVSLNGSAKNSEVVSKAGRLAHFQDAGR